MDLSEYRENYSPIFELLKTLSKDQIDFKPEKDKWSIYEIITHLADTEVQSHVRFRTILANKNPEMIYFDEMDWSVILDYTKVDLRESLEVIELMRRVNANLLSRLAPEYFNKKGFHTVQGELSLGELVNFYVQHVNDHLKQIKKNLSLMGRKK
jgi:hypothetical protein